MELVLETPERWLVDWYNQTSIEKRHSIVVISDKVIWRQLTYLHITMDAKTS